MENSKSRSSDAPVRAAAREVAARAREELDETQRRLIAEATCQVIARDGLEKASLRRIADELDCTTGLIHHYYSNKEELLVGALQSVIAKLQESEWTDETAEISIDDCIEGFVADFPLEGDKKILWSVYTCYRAAALSSDRLRKVLLNSWTGEVQLSRAIAAELDLPQDAPEVVLVYNGLDTAMDAVGMAALFHTEEYSPERIRVMLRGIVKGLIAEAKVLSEN